MASQPVACSRWNRWDVQPIIHQRASVTTLSGNSMWCVICRAASQVGPDLMPRLQHILAMYRIPKQLGNGHVHGASAAASCGLWCACPAVSRSATAAQWTLTRAVDLAGPSAASGPACGLRAQRPDSCDSTGPVVYTEDSLLVAAGGVSNCWPPGGFWHPGGRPEQRRERPCQTLLTLRDRPSCRTNR